MQYASGENKLINFQISFCTEPDTIIFLSAQLNAFDLHNLTLVEITVVFFCLSHE